MKRETFSFWLGFILISADCAIGLDNVWRFPHITERCGGAAFVTLHLLFLVIMGLPMMGMESSVGRVSRKSAVQAFDELEPRGTKWHWAGWSGVVGNDMLMMFYTTVCGWMLYYVYKMASGGFACATAQKADGVFSDMLAGPSIRIGWMAVSAVLGFLVCSGGLQKGMECIAKGMMLCLLGIRAVLCVRSLCPARRRACTFIWCRISAACWKTDRATSSMSPCARRLFMLSLGVRP